MGKLDHKAELTIKGNKTGITFINYRLTDHGMLGESEHNIDAKNMLNKHLEGVDCDKLLATTIKNYMYILENGSEVNTNDIENKYCHTCKYCHLPKVDPSSKKFSRDLPEVYNSYCKTCNYKSKYELSNIIYKEESKYKSYE